MLTPQEEQFVKEWEVRRLQKKKWFNFSLGLPLAVLVVVALFINLLTGWHKRAAMDLRNNTSVFLVILLAGIAIVVFVTFFAGNYQREQNEQRYQELLAKKNASQNKEADKTF